jgi:hypothetical protein
MLETYIEYGELSAHIMCISCFSCLGSATFLGRPSLRGCKWSAGSCLIAHFFLVISHLIVIHEQISWSRTFSPSGDKPGFDACGFHDGCYILHLPMGNK